MREEGNGERGTGNGELGRVGESASGGVGELAVASELYGARARPYDWRWGTPEQVKDHFGLGVVALKAAWSRGWVRARQPMWENDGKRTQTVYCFEDIHGYMERVLHQVTEQYAEQWWTDESVKGLAEVTPEGPYLRGRARGPALTRREQNPAPARAKRPAVRKDGFMRLSSR